MNVSLQRMLFVLFYAVLRLPFFGHAASPTLATRLEVLNRSLDHAQAVRVTTGGERFVVRGARADSIGIGWTRREDRPLEDSLYAHEIPWRDIVEIDVSTSAWTKEAKRGGVWGGTVGLVGSTVAALAAGHDINSLTLGMIGGMGGYVVGWTTGAGIGAFHRSWRMIYPRRQGWLGRS
jgi:hypothetical protein